MPFGGVIVTNIPYIRPMPGVASGKQHAMKFRPQALRIVIPVRVGSLRGAGDLVALAAEPVKHVIRRLAPDWDCGGCDKRRETLNRIVQFKG